MPTPAPESSPLLLPTPTPSPTPPQSPSAVYTTRHTELRTHYDSAATLAARLKFALLAAIAAVLAAVFFTLHDNAASWPILAAALAAAVLLNRYLQTRRLRDRLLRLLLHYELALGRVNGTQTQSGHTGEEFRTPAHLSDRDLAILGPDSLFGLLATVRTGVGRQGLARHLLHLPTGDHARNEIYERRQAIRELTPRNDLREDIALLGTSRFQEVAANFFDHWLEADPSSDSAPPASSINPTATRAPSSAPQPAAKLAAHPTDNPAADPGAAPTAPKPDTFHPALRPSLYVTSAIFVLLAVLGLTGAVSWAPLRPNLLAILAIQAAIALSVRRRVVAILDSASRLASQVEMFRDGLALLQSQSFAATRLQTLQQSSRSPHNAIPVIAALQRQLVVVEQRPKEWFLVPSLLLCAGTQTAISITRWKRDHAASMKQWLAVWAEFETLSALATYAYEHPENIYPEISLERPVYEASNLRHPLLPASSVGNTVHLGAGPSSQTSSSHTSLYLISGSNMAGKSTLLRTLGLNAVLGSAGAPICASAACLSPFTIGASIALSDSLAEGKSKFLAEVERLHAILQAAQQPAAQQPAADSVLFLPALFLIDEIFSGTNSLDRRAAAQSVARSLVAHGAIGALSTHDLTLTEMASDPALHATNVHMASPDPADPLAFDYLLKPGINQTSNALAILHMIGLNTS